MIVDYHRMRPEELVERRRQMPVAYFGLGILEWHGLHNPLGLDGLKADGVARHVAQQLGGIVMPPLYWGDNREEICELVFDPAVSPWLPHGTTDHTEGIMKVMGLEKEAFEADAARSKQNGGWQLWEALVVHSLFQIQTLGFELIIPIPGHYPLIGPLRRAVEAYEKQGGSAEIFILTDMMYSPDEDAGDHAAAFETSVMMALDPALVKIEALNPDSAEVPIGVLGEDPRTGASVAFGMDILAKMTELVRGQLQR